MIVRASIRLFAAIWAASSAFADESPDHFLEMVARARQVAIDHHIDVSPYLASGRAWMSVEGEWSIPFTGSGSQSGHYFHVLICDGASEGSIVIDK